MLSFRLAGAVILLALTSAGAAQTATRDMAGLAASHADAAATSWSAATDG